MDRVLIVGAGLVGSLWGAYLARRGYRVEIYDRRPDPRRAGGASGRSINLTLCERGFRALDRTGAGDRVREVTLPAYGRVVHGLDGGSTFQPYGHRREAIYSVSRNALNEALLSFAEEQPGLSLRFGERLEELVPAEPRALFRDAATGRGIEVAADRLFGADGASSTVRAHLLETGRVNYSQHYVEQGYKELTVPPADDGGWRLDKHAIHVWPRGRRMLIGFANLDGSFTMALHLPFEGDGSFESIASEDDLSALFRELFADALPLMPTLVEDYFDHPASEMVTIRCFPWTYRDKVALLGDSAHAIVPSYGQGANCGFEDCSVLADCLDEAGGDWGAAFAKYERLRHPNTEVIAELALEHFGELQTRLSEPWFLLRKRLERRIEELYPETYVSLYSLISFTDLPYAEARRLDGERRRLVDRLLAMDRAEEMLDSLAMDDHIHEAFGAGSAAGASGNDFKDLVREGVEAI